MDAIIINRVSDRKQTDGYSLDAQQRLAADYAKENGFRVIKEYTFQETASKFSQRSKFQEMLSFVAGYQTSARLAIVVEKPDRLGRNHRDKETIQELYLKGKIEVHFYKDKKIYNNKSTATDIFIDDIMTSVGKYAALNIARESIKGMQEKCEQGWYPAKAPLGYKNISDPTSTGLRGRKILVPDPLTAPLVNRIFELRAQMLSYHSIRMQCIEEGLVPEGRLRVASSIEKIVKNSFYSGTFEWRGKTYKGEHALIIPVRLYEVVQKTLRQGGKPWKHKEGTFSSWLRCSCGCKITYDPKMKLIKTTGEKKLYPYYRCSNGRRVHAKLKYISEGEIMNTLGEAVSQITITEDLATDISNALEETHRKVKSARVRELEGYSAALKALEQKEDEVYDDMRRGILDNAAYKRHVERVRADRERFTSLMAKAQLLIDDVYLETAKRILELAKMAKSLWDQRTVEEKRDFLERILSNRVLDGVSVRYEMKKPFQIVSEMASSTAWRPHGDSNSGRRRERAMS